MQTMVRVRSPNPPGDTREVMQLARVHLDGRGLDYKMVNRDETMPNLVATQAYAGACTLFQLRDCITHAAYTADD